MLPPSPHPSFSAPCNYISAKIFNRRLISYSSKNINNKLFIYLKQKTKCRSFFSNFIRYGVVVIKISSASKILHRNNLFICITYVVLLLLFYYYWFLTSVEKKIYIFSFRKCSFFYVKFCCLLFVARTGENEYKK